jgi:hypothetical protein
VIFVVISHPFRGLRRAPAALSAGSNCDASPPIGFSSIEGANFVLRHEGAGSTGAQRRAKYSPWSFRGAAQQAGGHEFEVVALRALFLGQQVDVGRLLDARIPGAQRVNDVLNANCSALA